MQTLTRTEPFDLTPNAIERIAHDGGAEDANDARRILRAYWFSNERKKRDQAIAEETIRRLEVILEHELPRDLDRAANTLVRSGRHAE